MKRMIILAAAVVCLVGSAVTPLMAADATLSVDAKSAYVWRGITLNDGFVIQPSIDVAAKNGFGINVWGNFDVSDYDKSLEHNEFSEVDLTLYYGKTIGKVDVGAGVIEYLFPNTGNPSTTELYLSLGMPIAYGLSVGVTGYYDIDQLKSLDYVQLNLGYSHDFTDKFNVSAGATAGYASDHFARMAGGDGSGLFDYSLSLSAGYKITDAWSVSVNVTYVNSLDKDNLKDKEDGGALDTNTIVGANVSYAF
jgi:hypothetical protein